MISKIVHIHISDKILENVAYNSDKKFWNMSYNFDFKFWTKQWIYIEICINFKMVIFFVGLHLFAK